LNSTTASLRQRGTIRNRQKRYISHEVSIWYKFIVL
jgi:hypothetical protein